MPMTLASQQRFRIISLLSPAYLWLTVAIFLPLSAMLYFSFLSDVPFGQEDWRHTTDNYQAFFQTTTYAILLWKSVKLGLIVTACAVLVGFPCAYVLAKTIKGRAREALFLLVILPFWSNSLVRIFSWAIVLRGNGVLEIGLNTILPFEVDVNLMFSTPAIVIGLVHSYLPYVILTSYLALQAIDDNLIDAARSMGAAKLTILWRIIFSVVPARIAGGCGVDLCAGCRLVHGTPHSGRSRWNILRHSDRRSVCRCL